MSIAKLQRVEKRQLGQFLTPPLTAAQIVATLDLEPDSCVLEPGFGDGSFVMPLVLRFLDLHSGPLHERLRIVLTRNVFGVEIDPAVRNRCLSALAAEFGSLPASHNLVLGDFLDSPPWVNPPADGSFTHVVGNPPFGGSLDPAREDLYELRFGERDRQKIKKETYSFFIVKALDDLRPRGVLKVICSDTMLSINTMRGLRDWVMRHGQVTVEHLESFSPETTQGVIVLEVRKTGHSGLRVFGQELAPSLVNVTPNHSWLVTDDLARYFGGPCLGDFMVATGGMTTGRNEYFVRQIHDGRIIEPYEFEFRQRPVSLASEVERARLGQVPTSKRREIAARERRGELERYLHVASRAIPITIDLPHEDYRYYNKSTPSLVYAPPTHVIFWKDEGDAVLTYKKSGNWYLRGVGGGRYFGREGLTWSLISSRIRLRFLPAGYILDSGAPAAFLRPGIDEDELYFILGWGLTRLCSRILKSVINHTRNIQGKDFERLPYPYWVPSGQKLHIIGRVRALVDAAHGGRSFQEDDGELAELEIAFQWRDTSTKNAPDDSATSSVQESIWAGS